MQGAFPALKELHLGKNQLDQIEEISNGFVNLELINLQTNLFSDWKQISKLGTLLKSVQIIDFFFPHSNSFFRLETLFLNENKLTKIEPPTTNQFPSLKALQIANNLIDNWASIDALNSFPNLVSVRLSSNPLFEGQGSNTRLWIIARVGKLEQLNGSTVIIPTPFPSDPTF